MRGNDLPAGASKFDQSRKRRAIAIETIEAAFGCRDSGPRNTGQVGLGIEVYDERIGPAPRKERGQIERGSRFADTAFLIEYREPSHRTPSPEKGASG